MAVGLPPKTTKTHAKPRALVDGKTPKETAPSTKGVQTKPDPSTVTETAPDAGHIQAAALTVGTSDSPIPLSARPTKGGASLFATLVSEKLGENTSKKSDVDAPSSTSSGSAETSPSSGALVSVAYASEAFRSAGPRVAEQRTPRANAAVERSFFDQVKRLFGLEKYPAIVRTSIDDAQVQTFRRAATRLVDRSKWMGASAQERSLFIQATEEHLAQLGVKGTRAGGRFVIEPHKTGSALNVLAWSVKQKLGGTLVFDVDTRLQGGLGAWHHKEKQLDLDIASVAFGRASAVAVHELHHAALDAGIAHGDDPLLGFHLYSTDARAMSSADLYTGQMSGQELSTFAKHQRMLFADEIGASGAITQENRHTLLMFTRAIREVAKNAVETSAALGPELLAFSSGRPASVTVEAHERGDLVAVLQDAEKGLHHLAQLQTSSPAQRARFSAVQAGGAGADEAKRAAAAELSSKLALSGEIASVMMDVERAMFLEIEKLAPGAVLSGDDQRALKDLLSWPGYLVRVVTDESKPHDERVAELARQKALAQARIAASGQSVEVIDARMNEHV